MLDRVTQGSLLQMHPPGDNGWNVDLEWGYRRAFLKGSLRTLHPTAWRRGWDSNPRDPCGPNGFQDRRFQPLTHPSELSSWNIVTDEWRAQQFWLRLLIPLLSR